MMGAMPMTAGSGGCDLPAPIALVRLLIAPPESTVLLNTQHTDRFPGRRRRDSGWSSTGSGAGRMATPERGQGGIRRCLAAQMGTVDVADVAVMGGLAGEEQPVFDRTREVGAGGKTTNPSGGIATGDPRIMVPVGEDQAVRHAVLNVVTENRGQLRQCIVCHGACSFGGQRLGEWTVDHGGDDV